MAVCPKCNQEFAEDLFECPNCIQQEEKTEQEESYYMQKLFSIVGIALAMCILFYALSTILNNYFLALLIVVVGVSLVLLFWKLSKIQKVLHEQAAALNRIEKVLIAQTKTEPTEMH